MLASVKNVTSYSNSFSAFKKFLSYLVSRQSIEFSIQKSIVRIILSQTPLSATTGKNTSVGIGLIELKTIF